MAFGDATSRRFHHGDWPSYRCAAPTRSLTPTLGARFAARSPKPPSAAVYRLPTRRPGKKIPGSTALPTDSSPARR